jgi:ubiquinol-cytochrome c reductase cytochrome c subunit
MPLRSAQRPVPQQAPPGPPQFSNADILALDRYVSSLGGSGASTTLPKVQRGDLVDGRALYEENCASCHAPSGIGYTQVSGFVAPFVLFSSPQTTADAIRSGPALMPQFPKSVFDQKELNDLVTYVQYLRRPQVGAHGGASIGRIGAAIEALVAFAAVAFLMLVIRLLGKRSAEGQQP